MLWAMKAEAPATRAAATRFRVPSVRMRSLPASSVSALRGFIAAGRSVSWWMTTSGRAAPTASASRSASKTSVTAASAPIASIAGAFSADLVIAVTPWPLATSIGTSRLPITPVPPATKILMALLLLDDV
jgi:hypothetical protein